MENNHENLSYLGGEAFIIIKTELRKLLSLRLAFTTLLLRVYKLREREGDQILDTFCLKLASTSFAATCCSSSSFFSWDCSHAQKALKKSIFGIMKSPFKNVIKDVFLLKMTLVQMSLLGAKRLTFWIVKMITFKRWKNDGFLAG